MTTKIKNIELKENSKGGLPEDWVVCELGEVCEINMGQSPPSSTYNINKKGLPFFQGKAEFTDKYPVVRKWCTIPKKIANKNDILLSVRAPVGTTNIANEKCAIGRGLASINYSFGYKFIWYFLQANESSLKSQGTGTTFKAVSGKIIKSQKIPLPPLPIQRALVRKIESLFSSLDSGIADLKKAQEQLKIYRQAVLKKAFEGEWEKTALEKVSTAIGGNAFKSKSFLKEKAKYQIIRIGNVRPGIIRLNASPVYKNEIEDKVKDKYLLKKGDVIITLTGTRKKRDYGYTAMVKSDNLLLNQRLAYLRFNNNYVPLFFLYFSWSEHFKEQFFSSETGNVGQGNVGMKAVRKTLIPDIKKEEQHAIVREIESRLSVCDAVEKNITESLKKAELLRQSILKKAFSGQLLTEKEIEQCKQEKDYEPADKLLERIKKIK